MAAKIPAAQTRMFKDIFICKNCSAKKRSSARRIIEGKVRCRNCNGKLFRQKRKK